MEWLDRLKRPLMLTVLACKQEQEQERELVALVIWCCFKGAPLFVRWNVHLETGPAWLRNPVHRHVNHGSASVTRTLLVLGLFDPALRTPSLPKDDCRFPLGATQSSGTSSNDPLHLQAGSSSRLLVGPSRHDRRPN